MHKPLNQNRHATSFSDERRKCLSKIHIGKKSLGMDDATYRSMLFNIGGVHSAVDLDTDGLKLIIEHLKKCGFKPRHKSARLSGMMVKPTFGRSRTSAQLFDDALVPERIEHGEIRGRMRQRPKILGSGQGQYRQKRA